MPGVWETDCTWRLWKGVSPASGWVGGGTSTSTGDRHRHLEDGEGKWWISLDTGCM